MHYMSPQISYLVTARPLSVTMGNAIRALKYEISILDIDLPEQDVSVSPSPSGRVDMMPTGQIATVSKN